MKYLCPKIVPETDSVIIVLLFDLDLHSIVCEFTFIYMWFLFLFLVHLKEQNDTSIFTLYHDNQSGCKYLSCCSTSKVNVILSLSLSQWTKVAVS